LSCFSNTVEMSLSLSNYYTSKLVFFFFLNGSDLSHEISEQ